MRAYWKGHLRLSLVTIGVELYSASSRANDLSLHQIHKPSGKRIRYEKVAPGIGPVELDDIVKGVEIEKGEYVTLEPDELDEIKLDSKRTIDLIQFVEHCEIDPRYFDRPYYVVPTEQDVAEEGFAVIRDALRDAKRVGLGQMATRGRDQICAVKPCGDGLLLETLRYASEVRDSERVFSAIPDVKVDKEMLELAGELIERKSAPFDPEAFKSQYAKALRELVEEKRKKGKVSHADDEELETRGGSGNVVDLMEALRKSVKGGKDSTKSGGRKKSARSTSTKTRTASKSTRKKAS